MGCDVGLRAIIRPDEEYKRMYAVYKACEEAGVALPDKVFGYFEEMTEDFGREPTEMGLEVDMYDKMKGDICFEDGTFIDVRDLPKGT